MKRILIVILLIAVLVSCSKFNFATGTFTRFLTPEQVLTCVPDGFEYVSNAGNGWHFLRHESGKYLVSVQGSGESGTFIQMTWIGN